MSNNLCTLSQKKHTCNIVAIRNNIYVCIVLVFEFLSQSHRAKGFKNSDLKDVLFLFLFIEFS